MGNRGENIMKGFRENKDVWRSKTNGHARSVLWRSGGIQRVVREFVWYLVTRIGNYRKELDKEVEGEGD